jgi:hypothetical protein
MLRSAADAFGLHPDANGSPVKHDLLVTERSWSLVEPFETSRGTQSTCEVIVIRVTCGVHAGRGEAVGVDYHGESIDLSA